MNYLALNPRNPLWSLIEDADLLKVIATDIFLPPMYHAGNGFRSFGVIGTPPLVLSMSARFSRV